MTALLECLKRNCDGTLSEFVAEIKAEVSSYRFNEAPEEIPAAPIWRYLTLQFLVPSNFITFLTDDIRQQFLFPVDSDQKYWIVGEEETKIGSPVIKAGRATGVDSLKI